MLDLLILRRRFKFVLLITWLSVASVTCCLSKDVILDQGHIRDADMSSYLYKDHSCPPKRGNRTEVTIRSFISQIRSGSVEDTTFSMYLYLNWHDDRLKFKADSENDYYVVHRKLWNNVWIPHIFIENDLNIHTENPAGNSFLWIYPNGTLLYGSRFSPTVNCPSDKIRFPKGYLSCQLYISINSFEKKSVFLAWEKERPVMFAENYEKDKIILTKWSILKCNNSCQRVIENSCIELQMNIQKHFPVSILRLYLPSIFIVIVGWLSFWIDKDEVSSRVKLGTLCLLSMITEEIGISMLLPNEMYIIEIEIWFSVCLAFVTFVMCEFALVHALDKIQTRSRNCNWKSESDSEDCKMLDDEKNKHLNNYQIGHVIKNVETVSKNDRKGTDRKASYNSLSSVYKTSFCCFLNNLSTGKIERNCRIIYAVAFTLFQISYWLYYLINDYSL